MYSTGDGFYTTITRAYMKYTDLQACELWDQHVRTHLKTTNGTALSIADAGTSGGALTGEGGGAPPARRKRPAGRSRRDREVARRLHRAVLGASAEAGARRVRERRTRRS
jgi:hypothetical protein